MVAGIRALRSFWGILHPDFPYIHFNLGPDRSTHIFSVQSKSNRLDVISLCACTFLPYLSYESVVFNRILVDFSFPLSPSPSPFPPICGSLQSQHTPLFVPPPRVFKPHGETINYMIDSAGASVTFSDRHLAAQDRHAIHCLVLSTF